jgi:class 3 adenylate cyclase
MIISAATHAHLTGADLTGVEFKKLPPTQVKGKSQPVEVYAVP